MLRKKNSFFREKQGTILAMTDKQRLFQEKFSDIEYLFDFPLAEKSYFKIGGKAEIYYEAKTSEDAEEVLAFAFEKNIPVTPLGGASNVLISEDGIPGLVIHLAFTNFSILEEDSEKARIRAEVGMKTNQLVARVAQFSLTGLEGFIGVPGTLGGAIYNNAHYLNFLISDYIESVEVFNAKTKEKKIFTKEDCQFAYEKSIFQSHKELFIFSAIFDLKKADKNLIREQMREAQERRQRTQPLDIPSSGCFFQNPQNTTELQKLFPQFAQAKFIPAGFLIDQAGLKGLRQGDIQISPKHASFLVNLGEGKEADVKILVKKIKKTVQEKFGVDLEEEVFYL